MYGTNYAKAFNKSNSYVSKALRPSYTGYNLPDSAYKPYQAPAAYNNTVNYNANNYYNLYGYGNYFPVPPQQQQNFSTDYTPYPYNNNNNSNMKSYYNPEAQYNAHFRQAQGTNYYTPADRLQNQYYNFQQYYGQQYSSSNNQYYNVNYQVEYYIYSIQSQNKFVYKTTQQYLHEYADNESEELNSIPENYGEIDFYSEIDSENINSDTVMTISMQFSRIGDSYAQSDDTNLYQHYGKKEENYMYKKELSNQNKHRLYIFIKKFYKGNSFPEEKFQKSISSFLSIIFQDAVKYTNEYITEMFYNAKIEMTFEKYTYFRIYRAELYLFSADDVKLFLEQKYISRQGCLLFFHYEKNFRLPPLKKLYFDNYTIWEWSKQKKKQVYRIQQVYEEETKKYSDGRSQNGYSKKYANNYQKYLDDQLLKKYLEYQQLEIYIKELALAKEKASLQQSISYQAADRVIKNAMYILYDENQRLKEQLSLELEYKKLDQQIRTNLEENIKIYEEKIKAGEYSYTNLLVENYKLENLKYYDEEQISQLKQEIRSYNKQIYDLKLQNDELVAKISVYENKEVPFAENLMQQYYQYIYRFDRYFEQNMRFKPEVDENSNNKIKKINNNEVSENKFDKGFITYLWPKPGYPRLYSVLRDELKALQSAGSNISIGLRSLISAALSSSPAAEAFAAINQNCVFR